MNTRILTACCLALLATATTRGDEPKAAAKPRIEVCFVLDTTGSMSGLIEGAKEKIWSIANEMIAAKPTPELRLALVGYRDRGDEYVTKLTDLTADIDAIHAKLMEFSANGGGDGPESVNQALHEAVTKISWSDDGPRAGRPQGHRVWRLTCRPAEPSGSISGSQRKAAGFGPGGLEAGRRQVLRLARSDEPLPQPSNRRDRDLP